MKYTKDQRSTTQTKPQPADGWHTMKIVREMPNPKQGTMHTFILEGTGTTFFWNVFLREIDAVGEAVGVKADGAGVIDTGEFVGKTVRVQIGDRFSKDGKAFKNVLAYTAAAGGGATGGVGAAKAEAAVDAEIPF